MISVTRMTLNNVFYCWNENNFQRFRVEPRLRGSQYFGFRILCVVQYSFVFFTIITSTYNVQSSWRSTNSRLKSWMHLLNAHYCISGRVRRSLFGRYYASRIERRSIFYTFADSISCSCIPVCLVSSKYFPSVSSKRSNGSFTLIFVRSYFLGCRISI